MPPAVLNELRLLSSDQFDSRALLSVVLAGDARLNIKLARVLYRSLIRNPRCILYHYLAAQFCLDSGRLR
jgi:type II secretory pathway predicted ATPase ExeA